MLFTLRREERMKQVLAVTGDPIKELIVGVITDAGKSCRTVGSVTQSVDKIRYMVAAHTGPSVASFIHSPISHHHTL